MGWAFEAGHLVPVLGASRRAVSGRATGEYKLHPKIHWAYLWPDRIFNAHYADAGEVVENVILTVPVGLRAAGEVTVGHTDGPQPVTCHGLNHLLHHLVPVSGSEDPGFACPVEDLAAPEGTER